MRIYWTDILKKGNLGMMARPKGNDWLEDEIRALKNVEVNTIVSLLEKHEEITLEITEEAFFCKKYDIEYINFSIPDRGIPKEIDPFIALITHIDNQLKDHKKVIVHCRMGIGRTAMVVGAILIKNGIDPEYVFEHLSKTRTLTVPDTEEQKEWVKDQKKRFGYSK
ncbi:protein-tyrosine phosphatase family protein [Aquimarina algiphila]|uniref:protein-tyrosine phosphatase family protein n=1 Tax=Aquimarina algiphila TaxID=2047982 RepID=UPI00232F783C|nr:dual specificity protein phosphatase family protein [Aquimarina algiphila]